MENCDTNNSTDYLLDKTREVHLEVFCVLRCRNLNYQWFAFNLDFTNRNFYFDQNVDPTKLIIRPDAITHQKNITVVVTSDLGGWAQAILLINTLPLAEQHGSHMVCPDKVITFGMAHYTQFDACIRIKDFNMALTYHVYQKLWNVHQDRGRKFYVNLKFYVVTSQNINLNREL